VEDDLSKTEGDAKLAAMLGLVQAQRGQKDQAMAAARRAVELLPITRDAFDGPLIAVKLAVIYAQVGEADRALELLKDLVQRPNGPTPGTLRVEPEWDSLRGDPRFEALVNA
jgi:Flp pilus assembly protein TadD